MKDYIESLKEKTLEELLAEWALMRDATDREWKGGDTQNYHEFKAKAEAVKAHILASYRHRGGESLAEIRQFNAQTVAPNGVREALEEETSHWQSQADRIADPHDRARAYYLGVVTGLEKARTALAPTPAGGTDQAPAGDPLAVRGAFLTGFKKACDIFGEGRVPRGNIFASIETKAWLEAKAELTKTPIKAAPTGPAYSTEQTNDQA
jgi:hypothetical protein